MDRRCITYPGFQNIVIDFFQMLQFFLFYIFEPLIENFNLSDLISIFFVF